VPARAGLLWLRAGAFGRHCGCRHSGSTLFLRAVGLLRLRSAKHFAHRVGSPAKIDVDRQIPARSRLHHRPVRQEPPWRSHCGAADGAWLPGILGLSLPSRCHAAGELPRHQQIADRADDRAALQEHADPGRPGSAWRYRSQNNDLPDAPRNILWCHSSDGTEKNQRCTDEGPLGLDRSRTIDEEISAKVIDFLDRNDP
jgi:hypothetical protein